jgi:selenide,water dikinase
VGGHTVNDKEPKYGLAVVGEVKPGQEVTNADARPGDVLVLTKPLGTGIITTAAKQNRATTYQVNAAVKTMSALNETACKAMVKVRCHACTDVTGFGLLGHLNNMIHHSGVGARINLSAVPLLPGVRELAEEGAAPGGTNRNLKSVDKSVQWHPNIDQYSKTILCDAQTSGGLLISVAPNKSETLLAEMKNTRGQKAWVIGNILTNGHKGIEVLP